MSKEPVVVIKIKEEIGEDFKLNCDIMISRDYPVFIEKCDISNINIGPSHVISFLNKDKTEKLETCLKDFLKELYHIVK